MFYTRVHGSFKKTESFIQNVMNQDLTPVLSKYGRDGVAVLSSATPRDSGITAGSWSYRITRIGTVWRLTWYNSNTPSGFPVAVMIQYGYSTGTGGYVSGRDYINPVIRPIFDNIVEEVGRAVRSA